MSISEIGLPIEKSWNWMRTGESRGATLDKIWDDMMPLTGQMWSERGRAAPTLYSNVRSENSGTATARNAQGRISFCAYVFFSGVQ